MDAVLKVYRVQKNISSNISSYETDQLLIKPCTRKIPILYYVILTTKYESDKKDK